MTYSFIEADARPTIQTQIEQEGLKELQLFDDGVTYMVKNDGGGIIYIVQDVYVVIDDNLIDCVPDGWHKNQYMTPLCLEIILRHELDRRGL